MWCSTPHLGGQRSHGLGVGAVGKPLLPFGGARLPPVSLAPSCQKIFTENVLHRAHLVFCCAKPLRPAAYVVLDSTSRGAKVARTRGSPKTSAVGKPLLPFGGARLPPVSLATGLQHMWCSTPHLGGRRSHGLGVGVVGKPLLPFGGARLPPVSLAPSCQKIFTENVLHRAHLVFCCAKPLRPAAYVVLDSTSRGAKVARTRGRRRWKAAPPFWGGASASRFSGTFLSKDIHRKRPAPGCTSVKTPYPMARGYGLQHMWCSTPHLGGRRSHGLGVGVVGKPLLPFGGARLPPVSLAPSCQKIFTENVLHRAHLVFCCAKPLRPAAYVVLDSTSRGAKVARTRGRRRWKAAPPFWGGASASRFSGTFLSKDIHRKRPAPSTLSIKTPCAKPLRPAAYVVLDSTSRGAKVARTRGRRRWKAAPPFWGGASASRFSGTFLSKDIHRKRPAPSTLSILLCKAATASSICGARLHISGGKGRTDSGSAPLESRSSLLGGRVCLPFLWHLPVKRYSPKTSCTEHT